MPASKDHKEIIRLAALQQGFAWCGFARAVKLDDDARRLEQWLNKGHNAGMEYMANHFDMRVDPTLLVPGAKSVITLLVNYFPSEQQDEEVPKIARYAYGADYHEVIRTRLNNLLAVIRSTIGEVNGRGFVDSAPVLERAWALRSGAGWIGKNGNLITKGQGSWFFIATLITDLELDPDPPFATDHCGTCTRCIDACPTNAIGTEKDIDANRCISYLTIELKDEVIPHELAEKMQGWMFGCDICQEVCPWNRFAIPHTDKSFESIPQLLHLSSREWQGLGQEAFQQIFRRSPLKRAKWKGILRNLSALKVVGTDHGNRR